MNLITTQSNVSLKSYNTFSLDVTAHELIHAKNDTEIISALNYAQKNQLSVFILGGGSNVLFTQQLTGLVVRIETLGVRVLHDDGEKVLVEAEAGECWHDFVVWTLSKDLIGLENLSLIPGTVGAAPIQNIGAYGVEVKDTLFAVTAMNGITGKIYQFTAAECRFNYRDSVFKQEKGMWIVLRVSFILSRKAALHLDYGSIKQLLQKEGITSPTAKDVSQIVCRLRKEKLPDPKQLGNAGSFFKNPIISLEQAEHLKINYPNLISYAHDDKHTKLAAGWLIDAAGWKGFRQGDVGVHKEQALVLVNYGKATGFELLALAELIQKDIQKRFSVLLEIEPCIFPSLPIPEGKCNITR
ncbi:UNVERIFIED_CONTAM: hypothetical protein GTU68_005047 [Idotea baltica]|nr:hypothetical protein [Idotea baltica]